MVRARLLIFGLLAVTSAHPGTSDTTVYKQRITLYRTKNCTGDKTSFNSPIRNFSVFTSPFYTAMVNGLGLLYNSLNFKSKSIPFFDNYHNCYELLDGKGKLGSLRFAGDLDDYRRDTLNLYKEEDCKDEVQLLVEDAPKGITPVKSLIITGKSAWTLYQKPDYKERLSCVRPAADLKPYGGAFLNIKAKYKNFTSIQSVRKGCFKN